MMRLKRLCKPTHVAPLLASTCSAITLLLLSLPPVAAAQERSLESVFSAGVSGREKSVSPELEALRGKKIRSIKIVVDDIFPESDGSFYRAANSLKVNTREEVIRRELLFKEGEAFDPFLIQETVRILRQQRFIRKVNIENSESGGELDVVVRVQDTWTLIPQVNFSSGTGRNRSSVGISESNILGLGKRFDLLFEEEENRQTVETVYQDPRVFGTFHRFSTGYFNRSDGERAFLETGRPLRTLLDTDSWLAVVDGADTVGRLFEAGEENYIYRQEVTDASFRYTVSRGNPLKKLRRYSFGFEYTGRNFSQATLDDYEDLDLDPTVVGNSLEGLPDDRRYSGPVFAFQSFEPNFLSANYIDRFDRVEDYNLGSELSFSAVFASQSLGSTDEAILLTANRSRGYRLGERAFARTDFGLSARYEDGEFLNSLIRFEGKYYKQLGMQRLLGLDVGRHTLAANFFLDFGDKLDKDREFLVGGDNVIRGYKAKAFSGDRRIGLNLEDRFHLAEDVLDLISLGGAFFFDAGGASDGDLLDLLGDDIYSDVGAGLRFAFPRSSGGSVLRVDLAFPLRDGPEGSSAGELRVVFAGGQLFSSRLDSEVLGAERANVSVGFDR